MNPQTAQRCEKEGCRNDLRRTPRVKESELQADEESAVPAVSETCTAPDESQPESLGTPKLHTLRFLIEDRQELEVKDGDIIGRNEAGSEHLQNFPTVSRRHIQVFKQHGAWRMKNLAETNGTWLNDKPVPQNEEREINMGDVLKLSSGCHLMVM
jgi:hypothetical protein